MTATGVLDDETIADTTVADTTDADTTDADTDATTADAADDDGEPPRPLPPSLQPWEQRDRLLGWVVTLAVAFTATPTAAGSTGSDHVVSCTPPG